jgi:hypothetical protein
MKNNNQGATPRWICGLCLAAAACGGPQASNAKTPLEKRRDAACEAIGPKLTECAVEDARSELAAGRVTQADFDRTTAPEIRHKNTERFIGQCTAWHDISSRQVRVLEVCFKAETECGALRDCLANLQAQ